MAKCSYSSIIFGIFILSIGMVHHSMASGLPDSTEKNKSIEKKYDPNQLIVKFKSGFSQQGLQQLQFSEGVRPIAQFASNGAVLVNIPNSLILSQDLGLQGLAKQWREQESVEYVEPNYFVYASVKPNDAYYEEQYALGDRLKGGGEIAAPQAWQKTVGSKKVLVAVVDSGVDYSHVDLAPNYWTNPGESGLDASGRDKRTNGIDDDQNGKIDDWRGWNFISNTNNPMDDNKHGTHCAGIIGAVGNNQVGVVGVNWNVSLVGLKFLDAEGVGTIADAVLAVEYALSIGAHIINNSWGGDEHSETMLAAIHKAESKGVLFVVAAGNNGNNNDIAPDFPASYNVDNVISVAAVDSDGAMAGFSNFGKQSVHIAAPGVQILSTVPGNQYERLDGTSMAAPYVSGAAALIKSMYPHLSAREIKARLIGTSNRYSTLNNFIHAGILNVSEALNEDFTAPLAPKQLSIVQSSASFLQLEWDVQNQAPEPRGIAVEVRIGSQPILSENDWQSATRLPLVSEVVRSQNGRFILFVGGIGVNSQGYLALKIGDAFGNISELSNSVRFELKHVNAVYANKGDSLDGLQIQGSWGIESVVGRGRVWSDSPGTIYGCDQTSILALPSLHWNGGELVLVFQSRFELESSFDFAFLEVSADGGQTWGILAQFTGVRDWSSFQYSVDPSWIESQQKLVQYDGQVFFRLRVTSDRTGSKDGWMLSNFVVYQ